MARLTTLRTKKAKLDDELAGITQELEKDEGQTKRSFVETLTLGYTPDPTVGDKVYASLKKCIPQSVDVQNVVSIA